MENPGNRAVILPWCEVGGELWHQGWAFLRLLVLAVGAYVMEWPFMCHAGLVLAAAWIASYSHLNVALVCCLGFLYLFQIEKRQRARLKRTIGNEERKKARQIKIPEGETVRWVNEVTAILWPIFLERFVSQVLLVPLNSFLDRFCKPWTVKKLVLQNLSLGKVPPTVTMVRVLDEAAEGDDLAVEASLEWSAAEDMAAVLAVQVLRRLGLGLWTPFHLGHLEIQGKVKMGIKFRNGWPVIERIRLCFAEAPCLDMKCHPIYNHGVDVSELPGIASYLDRLVADALAQSLVEPNQMKIDMVELMKHVTRPGGLAQSPRGNWFSFQGNPPTAAVTVRILEATDLRVGDPNGYSDPYVRVTLNATQHRETKVIWRSLNPKWNETFGFSIASWEGPNTLVLKVRDKDLMFDDQLGYQIVELSNYRDGKEHDIWLPLIQVETGKIHLLITVHERQTDSQSSEDVSNSNSTTFEKGDQTTPLDSDRCVPSEGSLALSSFPSDRISTRQRLKNFKSGKSASEESPGKKISRERSGLLSTSRNVETSHGLEKSSAPRDVCSADDTSIVLDVGFGELGAVEICQAGDVQPRERGEPEERHTKTLDQALWERECLTNVEEDGGAARKLRSAGLALHGKFHRARRGSERDSPTASPRQDLRTRRRFSPTANDAPVTRDVLDGQLASNSCAGSPTMPMTPSEGEVVDAEKHHLGTKAKGVFVKAAGQFSHQIKKKMNGRKKKEKEGVSSSEEDTTSGELAIGGSGPVGPPVKELGPGIEAPVTAPGLQQQVSLTSKPSGSSRLSASVPPARPPPELPQPVAPKHFRADHETTLSSPPLRPLPTQESAPPQGPPQPSPSSLNGSSISSF